MMTILMIMSLLPERQCVLNLWLRWMQLGQKSTNWNLHRPLSARWVGLAKPLIVSSNTTLNQYLVRPCYSLPDVYLKNHSEGCIDCSFWPKNKFERQVDTFRYFRNNTNDLPHQPPSPLPRNRKKRSHKVRLCVDIFLRCMPLPKLRLCLYDYLYFS